MTHALRQQIHIAAAPEVVATALTQPVHMAQWWTREAEGEGRHVRLDWSAHGWRVELDVLHDVDRRRVVWHCTQSNMLDSPAWVGSSMCFELHPTASGTRVDFSHLDYPDAPCKDTCEGGWAFFLGRSLKQYLETGEGMPYPDTFST
ncbi:ATPase [Stenotrophomonas panacihumi]|uniref:ATPase n=1 Tax=Stenotrophomonas panacihumi TaxID=676599 RepID=A0A0Q9ZXU3_9GAMM|nr:SRPBCC domain-containing protein [Stenotrophomonas panacihumi]KRG37696.1 ATPase [Stenotrophomonas panacihumi]PTN56130.1 SRPBCC domain-containing protein [Stenotrophomonas panacihumi]